MTEERPQEHEYASHVSYSRALEDYCTKLEQREWIGLTDEEFNDAINYKLTPRCIAIAIKDKLKEKNTT